MIVLALAGVCAGQSQPPPSGSRGGSGGGGTPAPSYRERYSVLAERNMFVRDRARLAPPRTGPTTREAPPPPRAPELSHVLTGIVWEDGEYRAYVENTSGGGITKVRVGDALVRGRVTQIDMDAIQYAAPGATVWVDIGRDLTGGQSAALLVARPSSPTTGPTTGPAVAGSATLPVDPNNPNLSLEERMRLRRAQEMNRR